MVEETIEKGTTLDWLKGFGGRMFFAGLNVYLILSLLFIVHNLIIGDRFWPIALLQNFAHWMTLPALILTPILFWQKMRWQGILSAVVASFFLLAYGWLFLPRATPVPDCNPDDSACPHTLRVMAYNLGSVMANHEQLGTLIAESDADVIVFEEIGPPDADFLDGELLDEYPYRALYGEYITGKGIMSRYPIVEESGVFYLNTEMSHMTVTIDVDGDLVDIIIAHPPRPNFSKSSLGVYYSYPAGTDDDYTALLEMTRSGRPTIMMGDFNNNDLSRNVRGLRRAGLRDAYRQAGWGFGNSFPQRFGAWEAIFPLTRIDYIWVTEEFTVHKAWVGGDAGSDHLPVLADLSWGGE